MKTTTIEGLVIRTTAKAFFLRIEGCESDAWVPRSQVSGWSEREEDLQDGCTPLRTFSCEVPAWLANRLPWNTRTAIAQKPW